MVHPLSTPVVFFGLDDLYIIYVRRELFRSNELYLGQEKSIRVWWDISMPGKEYVKDNEISLCK